MPLEVVAAAWPDEITASIRKRIDAPCARAHPGGRTYEQAGKVEHSLAVIDQATMLTLWAVFPNPNNVLTPGLKVRVISRLTE